jgi:hypothetical protein
LRKTTDVAENPGEHEIDAPIDCAPNPDRHSVGHASTKKAAHPGGLRSIIGMDPARREMPGESLA